MAAQVYDDRYRGGGIAWPAVAVMVAALLLAVYLAVDDDDDGEGAITRG